MIKTKKTKEILSEWRSFEKRSLNESSYSPSSGSQSIRKAVADFLACPESDLSDSSYIGEPIDEEFEFLIEAIKNEGGLPTSVSLNDMIFTDDQTCTIDWNNLPLDKNSEKFMLNDPDLELYHHRGQPDFDLFYYLNHAESRNPWVFAFFPKSGSSVSQWHGKLKIGGKGR